MVCSCSNCLVIMCILQVVSKSKTDVKDQESIQSRTIPDP